MLKKIFRHISDVPNFLGKPLSNQNINPFFYEPIQEIKIVINYLYHKIDTFLYICTQNWLNTNNL